MANANNHQVGGNHYRSDYQHWDWSLDVENNPMQYQITKYLRARKKGGVQDMEKLAHFIQKYVEQLTAGRRYPPSRISPRLREIATKAWLAANGMDELESRIALDIVLRDSPEEVDALLPVVSEMIRRYALQQRIGGKDV